MFILLNQLLTKIKIVQQNNNVTLKSLNKLLINVALQAVKIFVSFDISNIIFKKLKHNKK